MRGWMNEGKSYIAPVGLGDVMRAGGIGIVVRSHSPACQEGSLVRISAGVQEYVALSAEELRRGAAQPINLSLGTPSQWLNVLGMPGMTAYFGLQDIGKPQAGETLVVSGRPAPSVRPSVSWPRSGACAPSASPAVHRSASGCKRSSASMPASTKGRPRCCPRRAQDALPGRRRYLLR